MPEKTHDEQLADQKTAATAERDKISEGLKNLTDTIKNIKEEEKKGK